MQGRSAGEGLLFQQKKLLLHMRYLDVFETFTCYVVNRVEANPEPPDFVGVVAFEAPSCQLNSLPVLLSERSIVVDVESRTCGRTRRISRA